METRKQLHETALRAPKSSGVYLWKDEAGTVIYVGKAKNLKNRLSSYFSGQKEIKTRILVSRAAAIEYITTGNEYEALILENTLIKKYAPRYNISLKDDKSYPVIRVTNENFPRIFRTRRVVHDGSRYFGPYPNVSALESFIDIIYRRYPIRHCKILRKRTSPCMYYHIGRCSAPCCGKINKEDYNEYIEEIARLLEGDSADAVQSLQEQMKQASSDLKFEKAARLRDGIQAIRLLHEQNAVEDFDPEARDYVAYYSEGPLVTFTVLQMRGGKLIGRDLYRTRSLNQDEELLPEFLMAYYGDSVSRRLVPPRIFVPTEKGTALTVTWFNRILGVYPTIGIPRSGRHEAAMAMARLNAKEDIVRRVRERGDMPALEELRSLLGLSHLPARIEGFDIAHIGGRLPVASLISFYNGNPDKKNYRWFRLRTTDGVIDDFASMREAASRRYTRLLNEKADLPDLIMIDGGIGQVNAVQGVLTALDLDIPIIGLAKQDEELYLPGNSTPLKLPRRSDALRLLQRVRDETHRFATSRNQRLRTKENTTLVFEELPGVGSVRAKLLLDAFGSLEALAGAEAGSGTQAVSSVRTGSGAVPAAADTAEKVVSALRERRIEEIDRLLGCGKDAAAGIFDAAEVLAADKKEKSSSGIRDISPSSSSPEDLARLAASSGFTGERGCAAGEQDAAAEEEPDYGGY